MPFNTDGFLSPELIAWTASVRLEHKDWFDLAEELNSACMGILTSSQLPQLSTKQFLASLLYGRALQSYQGTILLAQRGMMADARTLVRSCAESAIVLGGAAFVEGFVDSLIAGDVKHKKTMANIILSNVEIKSELNPEQVEKLSVLIEQLKNENSQVINLEQTAQKAGFSVLYNTVYRGISGDAAHATIGSLDRHVQTDTNQNITCLSYRPESNDLDDTLSAAICALLHSLTALEVVLGQTYVGEVAKSFTSKWNALMRCCLINKPGRAQ